MPNSTTRTNVTFEELERLAMRAKIERHACRRDCALAVVSAAARLAGFATRSAARMIFGAGWSSGPGGSWAGASQKGAAR